MLMCLTRIVSAGIPSLKYIFEPQGRQHPVPTTCSFIYFHILYKNIPYFSVDDGAILDVIFKNFCYPPPAGYSRILFEKSLL